MFKNRKNLVSMSSLGGKKQLINEKNSRSSRLEMFYQKGFLKTLQNSQESICTGVFFIKVTDLSCFHLNSAKFLEHLFCKTKVNRCFTKPCLLMLTMFIPEAVVWRCSVKKDS